MDPILQFLQKDARLTPREIAKLTRSKLDKVKKKIARFQKEGVILGYKTVINKEIMKDKSRSVRALIEVNVVPQKDMGFDKVA